MSKLLISESPLQVLPSLAVAIGLNEAIILQQIHYLLPLASTCKNGKKWVYKSIKEWKSEQFPFFSEPTIKRAFNELKKLELIEVKQLSNDKCNKVNYYTINYDNLEKLGCKSSNEALGQNEPMEDIKLSQSSDQIEPMERINLNQSTLGQNDPMLHKNKTTSEITSLEDRAQSQKPNVKPPVKAKDLIKLGVSEQVAFDFLRTKKNQEITYTALVRNQNQAAKANLTLAEALEFAAEKGWQAFTADYYFNATRSQNTQGNHNAINQPTFGKSSAELYAEKLYADLANTYPDEFAPVAPTGVCYDH